MLSDSDLITLKKTFGKRGDNYNHVKWSKNEASQIVKVSNSNKTKFMLDLLIRVLTNSRVSNKSFKF